MADKKQNRIFITNKADTREYKLVVLQYLNAEFHC